MAATGDALEVALIGYGLAGAVFHAPLIDAVAGLRLAAVVTGDSQRGAAARARYPDVTVLSEPGAIWRDPRRYDLVVVASPNRTHVPLALEAVAAGIAVVVDKPLAANLGDARALRRAARTAKVPVGVFHNRRFDGDFLTVTRLLEQGTLGTVHRFESRFERLRPVVDSRAWRERPDPAEAGGVCFDLGSHLVDQALMLFGPVERVYAELRQLRRAAVVDDDAFLVLGHTSGVRSSLSMSLCAADLGPRLRVLGAAGSFAKFGLDGQEAELRAGRDPRDPEFGVEPVANRYVLATPDGERTLAAERGTYTRFYDGVVRALATGGPMPVGLDEAIAGLAVLEAARSAARAGQVTRVAPEPPDAP